MMRGNLKKSIGGLLTLILFFLGMCFENEKADSSFAYAQTAECSAETIQGTGQISVTELFAAESLGVHDTVSVQQIVNQGVLSGKFDGDSYGLFEITDTLLHIFSYFLVAAGAIFLIQEYGNTAVLQYIHNMDGKKRN
ncbi:MAG: hypothetical protein ACI4SE_07410 [Lachnospiraceae bacterium]